MNLTKKKFNKVKGKILNSIIYVEDYFREQQKHYCVHSFYLYSYNVAEGRDSFKIKVFYFERKEQGTWEIKTHVFKIVLQQDNQIQYPIVWISDEIGTATRIPREIIRIKDNINIYINNLHKIGSFWGVQNSAGQGWTEWGIEAFFDIVSHIGTTGIEAWSSKVENRIKSHNRKVKETDADSIINMLNDKLAAISMPKNSKSSTATDLSTIHKISLDGSFYIAYKNEAILILGTTTKPSTPGGTDGSIQITNMAANFSYTLNYKKDGTAQTPATITTDANGNYMIASLGKGVYTEINVTEAGNISNNLVVYLDVPVVLMLGTTTNPTSSGGTNGSIQIKGMTTKFPYNLKYKKDGTAQTPATITTDANGNYMIASLGKGVYTEINVTEAGNISNNLKSTLKDP